MLTDGEALKQLQNFAENLLLEFPALTDVDNAAVTAVARKIAGDILGIVYQARSVTGEGSESLDEDQLERVREAQDEKWSEEARKSVRPVVPWKSHVNVTVNKNS